MERVNLLAAWVGILTGLLVGAGLGLGFHREGWLGGYGSWPRRMLRLAHISFFGLAFVNLAFALSVPALRVGAASVVWPSRLFLFGAVAMPLVCFLAAARPAFRHLFFLPVLSLVLGGTLFLWKGLLP